MSESWSSEIIEQEENNWEDPENELWEWNDIEIIQSEVEIIEDEMISQSGWIIPEIESENNFNFWIKFQNPSYILEKDIEKTEYICDSDKEECKVNIVYIDEVWENLSTDYKCITEYSQWFESDNRCNPTTVIFTETTQVNYTVYLKNSPENKRQKSLRFIRETNILDEENNESDENNWNENDAEEESWEEENNQEDADNTENNTWTWETVPWENNNIESWSGNTSGSWIIIEDNQDIDENIHNNILPEIILEVQSGLEYSWIWNIYICEKENCKINLDISESFTWSFSESDYACEWNFWSGSFSTTNTDKKCNPGYVNYSTWTHQIIAKIIDKSNLENFTWATFQIQNIISTENNADGSEDEILENPHKSWTGNTSSGSVNTEENTNSWTTTWTGNIMSEIFLFPEIKISIQSWAEYLDNENMKCNKEDCKINLDVTEIFNEEFQEKNYICKWNFWSGTFNSHDTINKCNPWYVDYIIWDDLIKFQLFEKDNLENYIEKRVNIANLKQIKKSKSSWGSSWKSINRVDKKDYGKITKEKDIIIQSGLENNICNEKRCKINLNYEDTSYESCKWNFWKIEVSEKYKTTCNPWFIYADPWIHIVTLDIYNSKTNRNYNKQITFSNNYILSEIDFEPKFDIILQWKTVDYKKYYNSKIICLWVEKCNINLNVQNNSKDRLEYNWDFWNWEYSNVKNPKSVWFSTGSYKINLQIVWENIHEDKEVDIQVIWKEIGKEEKNIVKEFQFETEKENSFFTQIQTINFTQIKLWKNIKSEIFDNKSIIKKTKKIKELWWFSKKNSENKKLKLTRNISQQKKSLKYSWTTFPDSNIYILQWDNIIELQSDNTGKYSQKFTDLRAGNYNVEYYVLDSKWNLFENKKEKLLTLSHEYVESINNRNMNLVSNKYNKQRDKSKIIEYKNQTKNIKNIQHASMIPKVSNNTSNWEYIFQFILLVFTIIWSSILLRRYKIL